MEYATNLGFSTDPAVDNTPAWNAMLLSSVSHVVFDGFFWFKTQPNPINRVLRAEGLGTNASGLIRDFAPSSSTKAFIEATETVYVEKLPIFADGYDGGCAIGLYGLSASESVLRDLYITTMNDKTWGVSLVLHSTDPLGIRNVTIDSVELFRADVHGFWFVNAKGLRAGLDYYPAGGSKNYGTIQDDGVHNSESIMLKTLHLPELYLYNVQNLTLESVAGTTVHQNGNCTNINVV